MKRTIYSFIITSFLAVVLFIPFQSCDDYLSFDPVSLYSPENVFDNVEFTEKAVLGIYQLMTLDWGYSKRLNLYYGVDTDIEMCSGNSLDNGRRDIARYTANSGNAELENPFNNLYKGIERANLCIYNIRRSPVLSNGDDDEKTAMKRMLGESLTLRALNYYELVRNWGDVPFRTEPISAEDNFYLPKTDRDTIYNHIIRDLQEAVDLVPWRKDVPSDERITKGAVKGLLARICLARGGYSLRKDVGMQRPSDYLAFYQIARDQCWEIMQSTQHALNPDFGTIFKTMCKRQLETVYNENIWEIGLGLYRSGEVGYYISSRSNESSRYGKADGGILAVPTYYYSFDTLDTRRDITVAIYEIDEENLRLVRDLSDINIAKWRREWINPLMTGTDKYTGVNWVILRYSDVLLMFAEAENELLHGPSTDAINAFKAVRERAFKNNKNLMPPIPQDYQGFFNELVKERAWEFGGECIRKYDLLRWNLLGEKLNETRAELRKMYAGEAPYENMPRKMVWRNEGENFQILNFNFLMDSAALADRDMDYWPNAADWADDLNEDYVTLLAQYFEANRKELLPLHQNTLDNNPKLTDDFGH